MYCIKCNKKSDNKSTQKFLKKYQVILYCNLKNNTVELLFYDLYGKILGKPGT
jgi:hypothetical protein